MGGIPQYTRTYSYDLSVDNTNLASYSQIDFYRRCLFPKWADWNIEYTKKGVAQKRKTRAVRLLALVLLAGGAYRLRQSGLGVKDLKAFLQNEVKRSVTRILQLWIFVKDQVTLKLK
jgi:hypothetical protein